MMTGMLALFFLMYSVNGGATVYYAKDILGDKDLVTTINGIFNVVQIVGMFFIAMLVKRFGKRNVFALGLVFDIVGMLVLNYSGGAMNLIVVSSVIRGIGNACGGATMWAMVSDTIDYGEWKPATAPRVSSTARAALDIRSATASVPPCWASSWRLVAMWARPPFRPRKPCSPSRSALFGFPLWCMCAV